MRKLSIDPKDERWHGIGWIDAFLTDKDIPVLVRHTGHYPNAILPDGKTTAIEPHILIQISGSTYHPTGGEPRRTYTGVQVEAVGRYMGGVRQALRVYRCDVQTGGRPTIDPWLAKAMAQLPAAVALLPEVPTRYAAAHEALRVLDRYPARLDRPAYERACSELCATLWPDEDCSRWGVYTYPEYSVEHIIEASLAQRRGYAIADAAVSRQILPTVPEKTGQLWEPCRCGREPVHMPLLVCDVCWPKA